RRDIRSPEVHWLFHTFLKRPVAVNRFAVIFVSVTDNRKPVVLSLLDGIDLVTTARPMFTRPQFGRARVYSDPLHVPETERLDFRMCARLADERVVFRNRSIGGDAQDLTHVAVERLRLWPIYGIDSETGRNRRCHEQRTVRRLNHAAQSALRIQKNLHILDSF